jgi:hypothetical protein
MKLLCAIGVTILSGSYEGASALVQYFLRTHNLEKTIATQARIAATAREPVWWNVAQDIVEKVAEKVARKVAHSFDGVACVVQSWT